jgi:hypothetical protein
LDSDSTLKEDLQQVKIISRDRSVRRDAFTKLFSNGKNETVAQMGAEIADVYDKLAQIVAIMRRWPGASLKELVRKTGIPRAEVRLCIQIIITLGGELEVTCNEWETGVEGRFYLHN